MSLVPYNKPHATSAQRVAHLGSKGLIINRPNVAAKKIELIGYERLRIYFLSRRQKNVIGRPFIPGTKYQDIIRIYQCDMQLRDACFSAVGQFEILFRNAVSEAISDTHGSHPYYDLRTFKDSTAKLDALQTFAKIAQNSKDQRAKHYRQTYAPPVIPPIWTMKEFISFGAFSYIYNRLNGTIRTKVATQFGVNKDTIFTNWVLCLVDLRNICAHHDRIFNRSFQKQPSKLTSASLPTVLPNKLKAILECLDHMLGYRGSPVDITLKVKKILDKFPEIRLEEAGY